MTKPDLTLIAVLVDRSGSMAATKTDAEGGLRAFLAEQRAAPGETLVTLAQFDTEFETVHAERPIADVPDYTLAPRGMTALHDAVGKLVTEVGERLAAKPEDARPSRVYVVIVTDGEENSSREWSAEQVREAVETQRRDYGWEFVFIGANQDAVLTGQSLGVPVAAAATYDTSRTADTYAVASAAVTRSRVTGQGVGFTDDEREQVSGGG